MSEDNKLASLYFEEFIKNYEGTISINPRLNLHEFNSISTDTRTIEKGNLFLALDGENFHGSKFVDISIQKGASFFVSDNKAQAGNGILVKSSNEFLEDFAAFIVQKSKDLKIFGITGTNGKTSTKDLLKLILSKKFEVLATKGNLNNLIGLPLTILNLKKTDKVLVLEMGTNSKGEIERLANIARPGFATITNIGKGHTEKLEDEKTVFEEKKNIAKFFNQECVFAFNLDDYFLKNYFSEINCNKISFGIQANADVVAKNIADDFSRFDLCFLDQLVSVNLKAPGINNIYNSLCSASLALKAGLEMDTIREGIEEFDGISNRFKIINLDNDNLIINDTYNANPNSMLAAIEMTNKIFPGKKKIAILGDMLELGKISRDEHVKIGDAIVRNNFEELYTLGKHSGDYREGIDKKIKCINIRNHQDIKDYINLSSLANTVILVKGSRGMRMENVFDSLDI